jgi:hypothetical protein
MIGHYKTYEEYENALRERLNSLITLFNEETDFPFAVRILGFPVTRFGSREELIFRIKEICDILHEPYPVIKEITEQYEREVRIL